MTVEPIIRMRNVTKRFGSTIILDNLCLDVSSGEKIALIGPSGSGKTTILRALMTLETIDDGDIIIGGEKLWLGADPRQTSKAHLYAMRRKVGMVFQHFNLFPHLTVLDNITLAPILTQGKSRPDAESLGRELLAMVGMADKAANYPMQLSGGQKQRAAIARALALKPMIMLFDEVTSALDPELVEEVLNIMLKLARETDMTMLLVTHEMNFAKDFADRVLFLDSGRIVEEAPPSQLFISPKEERTRTFLRKILASGQRIDDNINY